MADLDALLDEAKELLPELVALRRAIHAEPELGLELPKTREKVLERLEALPLEIETHRKTSAVVATLRGAKPGRSILLRADMDALPMPEDTGLPFASKTAGAMHACGHDAHTAMLVGAAQLLAARRDELRGSVVFMFQPGEEGHAGARVHARGGPARARAEAGGGLRAARRARVPAGHDRDARRHAAGVGRRLRDHRARQGRPRLDAAPVPRPDPRRLRDRARAPDLRHALDRRDRSRP